MLEDVSYKEGITVIVPVYNSEKSLSICVESIINQVYKDWRLILVDDGSCDQSPVICDYYADKYDNITVIHKENGGVSSARNSGIDAAETKYIVFIDSDDYVSENYLQSLFDAKMNYPDAGHIWSTFKCVNNYDNSNTKTDSRVEFYSRNQLLDLFYLRYLQDPYCKLYNTDIVKNNICMDENISLGEDLIFNLEYLDLLTNESIVVINNRSYFYYVGNGESLDNKYRDDYLDIQLFLKTKLLFYIDKWNLDEEQYQKFYNSYLSAYGSVFENTLKKENPMSFIDKIKYNNSILKTDGFKDVFKKVNCYINPIVKYAYIRENYFLVFMFYKIAKLKNKLLS